MKNGQSLMLCKAWSQLFRHFLNSQLVPISFIVVKVHKIVEKLTIFINPSRNNQKLAINALAMKSSAWSLYLVKLDNLKLLFYNVNNFQCVIDQTKTLLKVIVSSKTKNLFIFNNAWVCFSKTFYSLNTR